VTGGLRGRVIFLLEEPSMKELLDGLLPRLVPGWRTPQHFQCVPHEGKSDLDRSIPRKLKAWLEPGVRFVVVRDNDNADCSVVKQRLVRACIEAGRPDTLVRLVCQELESWYLADLAALAAAFPGQKVDTPALRKRFADPDRRPKPSQDLALIARGFQKRSGARAMAPLLDPANSRSASFKAFCSGVERIAAELQGH
jgi:hypothetical protein